MYRYRHFIGLWQTTVPDAPTIGIVVTFISMYIDTVPRYICTYGIFYLAFSDWQIFASLHFTRVATATGMVLINTIHAATIALRKIFRLYLRPES
jgi:hypothetical protein